MHLFVPDKGEGLTGRQQRNLVDARLSAACISVPWVESMRDPTGDHHFRLVFLDRLSCVKPLYVCSVAHDRLLNGFVVRTNSRILLLSVVRRWNSECSSQNPVARANFDSSATVNAYAQERDQFGSRETVDPESHPEHEALFSSGLGVDAGRQDTE